MHIDENAVFYLSVHDDDDVSLGDNSTDRRRRQRPLSNEFESTLDSSTSLSVNCSPLYVDNDTDDYDSDHDSNCNLRCSTGAESSDLTNGRTITDDVSCDRRNKVSSINRMVVPSMDADDDTTEFSTVYQKSVIT